MAIHTPDVQKCLKERQVAYTPCAPVKVASRTQKIRTEDKLMIKTYRVKGKATCRYDIEKHLNL